MSDQHTTPTDESSEPSGETQDRGTGNEWQGTDAVDSDAFQEEVDRRLVEKQEAGPEDSTTQSPQEENKSDLPVLEQRDDSTANPGNTGG